MGESLEEHSLFSSPLETIQKRITAVSWERNASLIPPLEERNASLIPPPEENAQCYCSIMQWKHKAEAVSSVPSKKSKIYDKSLMFIPSFLH